MTFMETCLALEADFDIFDQRSEQLRIFSEAAIRENEIHHREAELRVMKENGTDDDLNYLIEAADEGLIERLAKTVQRIIQNLKELYAKIKTKIKEKFMGKDNLQKMNEIETILAKNPKLRKKKITIKDTTKQEKILAKASADMDKKIARLKAGRFGKNDEEELNQYEESINKKVAAAATATITIAIAGAIVIWRKLCADTSKQAETGDVPNVKESDIEKIKKLTPEAGAALVKAVSLKAKFAKSTIMTKLSGIPNIYSSIVAAISGKTISENLEESTELDDFDSDYSAFMESMMSDDDQSSTNSDYSSYSSTYFESMENEIFGDIDEDEDDEYAMYESTEDEYSADDFFGDLDLLDI